MAIFKSKAVTRDGRKWYFSICYTTALGERKRKKSQLYASKQEAQNAERQFLIEISVDRIDLTFKDLYYRYIDYADESIKGSTKYCKNQRIKNHILPYFGKMNIHDITVNTVLAWKAKINKLTCSDGRKYAVSYKQTLFKELRLILEYGVTFFGLKENGADKARNFHDRNEKVVADEEKLKYITPDEYNRFTNVAEKLVYKVFFAFLYYMGVRKGEAQALNWNDILWEKNKIRIIKTVTNKTDEVDEFGKKFKITNTKNRKNRTIKMPHILKVMLLELYQYYSEFEGFNHEWFVFGGYRHLPPQSICREKDKYFKLAKEKYNQSINRITNHGFRHSHASLLISSGIKPEVIAFRLGDTVAVVMKTYAHLFPEVEDEVIDTLDLVENAYIIKSDLEIPVLKKEFLELPQLKNSSKLISA